MKGKETGRARKTFTTEVYLGRVRKIKEKDEEKDRERKREKIYRNKSRGCIHIYKCMNKIRKYFYLIFITIRNYYHSKKIDKER